MKLLLHWMRKWNIPDNMLWKKAAVNQAIFIRDQICTNLLGVHSFVVSSHMSKSILLPVYAFTMKNGIKVICRENFYGWKLSVMLPQDRPYPTIIPVDLLESGFKAKASPCYFEGFEDSWLFEGYDPDDIKQRKFSFGIYSSYNFYTVMYMLKHLYKEVDVSKKVSSLTKEEVVNTIEDIYNRFGYNEIETTNDYGKPCERRIMSAWEILWETYYQLTGYEFKEKRDEEALYCGHEIPDNISTFADYIIKYPDVSEVFVKEAQMYNTKY